MLARRQSHRATKTLLWLGLLFALLGSVVPSVPVPARAEFPTVVTSPNATRTVAWTMNDSIGLLTQNVSFGGGNASLAWAPVSLNWAGGSDFGNNASFASNMSFASPGVSLDANFGNRLADGDFSSAAPWNFYDGLADNTTAQWIPLQGLARLNHSSLSTAVLWDSLSSIVASWTTSASIGSNSNVYQASGAMGDYVNVSAGAAQYAGAQHTGAVNWSADTQLQIWVYLNRSAPAAFNISALDSSFRPQNTVPVPLSQGWQIVTVDLTQLGPSRSSLTALTLRIVGINGQKLPPLSLYFLDIEVGAAKKADTTARVGQLFAKANDTTPLPGSAYLSFDWKVQNLTGVRAYHFGANLSGPGGTYASFLPSGITPDWVHFNADVSPHVTTKGEYNLSFWLQVVLDNITASNVTALVDNVAFVYPNRGNGSYVSQPLSFGEDSRYLSVSWSATLPSAATSVRLGIRTANSTSAWGSWHDFTTPGIYNLGEFGLYFQVRADLNTTNASVSPSVNGLLVTGGHHLTQGVIISQIFTAAADFLHWRSFNVSVSVAPSEFVSFWIGNGTYWVAIAPGSNISSFAGPRLMWRAILSTSDGLRTPLLGDVQAAYDYLGPPVAVIIAPGGPVNMTQGQTISFTAQVLDAGAHAVTYAVLTWSTTDPAGHVDNSGNYTAGSVGDYRVTATVSGMISVTQSVVVHVAPGLQPNGGGSGWDLWPYLLGVALAAVLGFGVYRLAVLRLFAIDDVFLIAKDGRLIIHNTRRMRADRDEDILSGMLTAIMAFLRDQDPEENGELKRFQVGGKTTLLERGEHVYLSAIYSGRVPGWAGKDLHRFMVDLEDRFGDAFAHWSGSPEDLRDLKGYMQRFVTHVRYRGDWGNRKPES